MSGESVLLCKSGTAGKWSDKSDPTGWWMSEKLDGLRARRDGKYLFSRNDNAFPTPSYFMEGFPSLELDGELWLGYKRFEETSSIVRNGSRDKGWETLTYRVFDAPGIAAPVEQRWSILERVVKESDTFNLLYVQQTLCTGRAHLEQMMSAVLAKGGEGVMLRKPRSYYERGRSGTIFKMKDFVDEEATVIGYEEIEINTAGKSHLKGAMGALFCLSKDGKKFKIGSGFTDAQRLNPPKLGALVTFKYQELTAKGIPRHPRFVAVRDYE